MTIIRDNFLYCKHWGSIIEDHHSKVVGYLTPWMSYKPYLLPTLSPNKVFLAISLRTPLLRYYNAKEIRDVVNPVGKSGDQRMMEQRFQNISGGFLEKQQRDI